MTLGMVWFPNWLRSNSPGKKISSRKSPKSAYSGTFNVDVDDDDNLDDDDVDNDDDDDDDNDNDDNNDDEDDEEDYSSNSVNF